MFLVITAIAATTPIATPATLARRGLTAVALAGHSRTRGFNRGKYCVSGRRCMRARLPWRTWFARLAWLLPFARLAWRLAFARLAWRLALARLAWRLALARLAWRLALARLAWRLALARAAA